MNNGNDGTKEHSHQKYFGHLLPNLTAIIVLVGVIAVFIHSKVIGGMDESVITCSLVIAESFLLDSAGQSSGGSLAYDQNGQSALRFSDPKTVCSLQIGNTDTGAASITIVGRTSAQRIDINGTRQGECSMVLRDTSIKSGLRFTAVRANSYYIDLFGMEDRKRLSLAVTGPNSESVSLFLFDHDAIVRMSLSNVAGQSFLSLMNSGRHVRTLFGVRETGRPTLLLYNDDVVPLLELKFDRSELPAIQFNDPATRRSQIVR